MGYATKSTRIRRATTNSVRFSPTFFASFVVGIARSIGSAVAELFRAAPAAGAAATPSGVASQTERSSATAARAATPGTVAIVHEKSAATTAKSATVSNINAELHRVAQPVGRASTPGGGELRKDALETFSSGTQVTFSSGSNSEIRI